MGTARASVVRQSMMQAITEFDPNYQFTEAVGTRDMRPYLWTFSMALMKMVQVPIERGRRPAWAES